MSLLVDETAGDLPVRDVGLMRGGLMPAVPGLVIHDSALKKKGGKVTDNEGEICFEANLFRL